MHGRSSLTNVPSVGYRCDDESGETGRDLPLN